MILLCYWREEIAQGREIWVDWKGREKGWGVGKNKENKLDNLL